MDYYQILNLNRKDNPSKQQIIKSYRKCAMKWHPDKWGNKPEHEQQKAEKKFKEINNAYTVLSDLDKKKMYDLYGEDGLNKNRRMPNNFRNGMGGKFFFGGNNDPFNNVFFNHHRQNQQHRTSVKKYTIKCSLEKLYNGCQKKIKISEGNSSKTILINILPGTKNNSEIIHNWVYNNKLFKIKFIIIQEKHNIYTRENDNLIYVCSLNSEQIKNKIKITLYDLNNGKIPIIICPNEVYQNYQKVIIGKGMPILKSENFGDLIISFNII
jgi:DnaJ homolog subfamily B member 4